MPRPTKLSPQRQAQNCEDVAGQTVIIALDDGAGRHAVVVSKRSGCTLAAERFELLDPRGPARRNINTAELMRQLGAGQMLLVFRDAAQAALRRAKFPLTRTARANRRFRASATQNKRAHDKEKQING